MTTPTEPQAIERIFNAGKADWLTDDRVSLYLSTREAQSVEAVKLLRSFYGQPVRVLIAPEEMNFPPSSSEGAETGEARQLEGGGVSQTMVLALERTIDWVEEEAQSCDGGEKDDEASLWAFLQFLQGEHERVLSSPTIAESPREAEADRAVTDPEPLKACGAEDRGRLPRRRKAPQILAVLWSREFGLVDWSPGHKGELRGEGEVTEYHKVDPEKPTRSQDVRRSIEHLAMKKGIPAGDEMEEFYNQVMTDFQTTIEEEANQL